MATLPAEMIRVEKPQRASTFETIAEESLSLASEELVNLGEVAPAPVITVKKQAFQSNLDTIWEETMQYMAEYLVSEAAEVILRRPVVRLNYFENLSELGSRQFFTDGTYS